MSAAPAIEQHRAWRAWDRLGAGPAILELTTYRESESKQRAIYRIRCSDGSRIVAKLAANEILEHERTVYERFLPQLPVRTPRYYGSVSEDAASGWLFLEDIGGERMSPLNPEHRRLAAAWLAAAHSAGAQALPGCTLPAGGPPRYLEHLRAGRRGLLRHRENPAFDADHRAVIDHVLRCCDRLEAVWSDVEAFSDSLPKTFAHGDFRPKNVHVRSHGAQLEIVAMDWETSGPAPCAVDLAPWHRDPRELVIDLGLYAERVRPCWPGLTLRTLERAVMLGQVFRQLAGIEWAVPSLPYEWPDKPVGRLRVYGEVLEDALGSPPWQV